MNSTRVIAGLVLLVAVAFIGGITYLLVAPPTEGSQPVGEPNVEITILGGEFDTQFGFGNATAPVESPGPELRVKQGDIVKITFRNAGQIPHTFRIVTEKKFDAPVLFGASVGSATTPVSPGRIGTTTFKASEAGVYFYICVVPGHPERGMFGKIVVESSQ